MVKIQIYVNIHLWHIQLLLKCYEFVNYILSYKYKVNVNIHIEHRINVGCESSLI